MSMSGELICSFVEIFSTSSCLFLFKILQSRYIYIYTLMKGFLIVIENVTVQYQHFYLRIRSVKNPIKYSTTIKRRNPFDILVCLILKNKSEILVLIILTRQGKLKRSLKKSNNSRINYTIHKPS